MNINHMKTAKNKQTRRDFEIVIEREQSLEVDEVDHVKEKSHIDNLFNSTRKLSIGNTNFMSVRTSRKMPDMHLGFLEKL